VPGCGRLHQARGLCARHRDEAGALVRKIGLHGAEYDQALDQTIADLIAGRTIPGQKPKRTPKPKPAPPPVADRHEEREPDEDQAAKLANLTTTSPTTNESAMPTPIDPSASPDGPNSPAPTLTPAEDASDPNAGPVGGTGGLPGDGGVDLEPPAGEEVEAPRFTLHHAPYLTPSDAEPPPVLPEHRGIAERDAADRDEAPRYDEDQDDCDWEEIVVPPPDPTSMVIRLPVNLEWIRVTPDRHVLFATVGLLPEPLTVATVRRLGTSYLSAEVGWHGGRQILIPEAVAHHTLTMLAAILASMGLPTIPPCPLAAEPAAD
jgi:hypothetical protein